MATNPFPTQTPFGGNTIKKDNLESKKQTKESPYELTGEASRDHVRKTFWDIFSAEADNDSTQLSSPNITRDLETQIFEITGSNCKSKEYRDMTKAIQLKLRGSRYTESRNSIRSGSLKIQEVCTQEFITAKTAPSGLNAAKGAQPGAQLIGRGRGLPSVGRGRGGPPMPAMGRGRGMPPKMGGLARAPLARPASNLKAPVDQPQEEEQQKNQEQEVNKPDEKLQNERIEALEKPQENTEAPNNKQEDRPLQIPVKKQVSGNEQRMRQLQINDTTLTDADQSKVLLQFDESIVEIKNQSQDHSNKQEDSHPSMDSLKRTNESKDTLVIQASLDESVDNQVHHDIKHSKKKKKKKKKEPKIDDLPSQPNQQIIQQLEDQIKMEQDKDKQNEDVAPYSDQLIVPEQKEQVIEEPVEVKDEPKVPSRQPSQKFEQVQEVIQESIPEKQEKIEETHQQKIIQKAEIGKLTKQNLDQQFQNTQQFDLPDIETESIIIQETDLKINDEKLSDLKPKRKNSESKNLKLHYKAVGEQIINNTNTIKSKSLTLSQVGAPESENIKRIQEALQSKKEINLELNQKIMKLEQEKIIRNKRQQLIQEENANIKEQLRQLQQENDIQAKIIREAQNDSLKNTHNLQRQIKDMDKLIHAQKNEIDHLKHEKDTYKERFQRALRDSQTQRELLERSINNQSFQHILLNIKAQAQQSQNSQITQNEGSSLIDPNQQPSASNQQEINLQKEITELKSKFEKQLSEQRHELMQRTRDLQKVEKKNVKYRENNRVLSEAVQGLENRNPSLIAGSGGVNQDVTVLYEHVLRVTNEDIIENMDYNEDNDQNMQFDGQNQSEIIQPRKRDNQQDNNQIESSNAGLFNQASELNSGEMGHTRRVVVQGCSGYFDNAQDEATGGESHSLHNNAHEEEKTSVQQNQQYLDIDLHIDQQSSSLVQDMAQSEMELMHMQNNNQSNENESDNQSKGIVKQAFNRQNYSMPTTSAVQQVNQSRNSDLRDPSQINENSNDQKQSNSDNSDADILSGDDDQSEDSQFNDDSGDSQDSQDDVSQESNDFLNEMNDEHSNINQRVPGAGSGNQELVGRNQMGHIGPGAIQQNQSMGQRHRQTGSNVSGSQRYNHGNMPHQVQQHNQQYNMGSSGGAQGINYPNSTEMFVSGTGSGGAAGEAGSSNKTAQRRNRRGYRQQNQQPSSGANDRDLNRRQNRNNRQGRQEGQEGGIGGLNNGNSQSYEDSNLNIGVDNRGRPARTSNRGRKQNNQQQQPQQIQNREASSNIGGTSQQANQVQVPSQGQTTALQPEPVSLSQERELINQNRFGAARQQQHDSSQAVQQVVNNLTNNNQNTPASIQSHTYQRTHGAAQSSSMMPASSASHNSQNYISAAQMINQQNINASAPHGGPHGYNGVVHTAHSNQGIHFDSGSTSHNPNTSQSNQQVSQRQNNRTNRQGATLSAQVSSSPSTQVIPNQSQQNRQHQSNDQQNTYLGIQPDLSGPGAVGAPPSISPPTAQNQDSQLQQNISPGSQVNTIQGQAQLNRIQPTVASVQNDQQSINIIPASVFGAGSGGGQETQHSGAMQAPAALGANNNLNYGGSGDPQDRNNVMHQISGTSLFEDQQQYSTINFNNMQDSNPTNRNNDSKKTSGAYTPSKDGAITPKTQQQHHGHSGGGQTQSAQEFISAVSVGLNSHLNNQSNNQQNYVHNLALIGQNNSHQERQARPNKRVVNQPNQNVSIIDQLSAAAQRENTNNFNPTSFLDDFQFGAQQNENGQNEEQVVGEEQQTSSLLGGDSNAAKLIPNNMFD